MPFSGAAKCNPAHLPTELFLRLFDCLPPHETFKCQRVCREWRDILSNDMYIAQAHKNWHAGSGTVVERTRLMKEHHLGQPRGQRSLTFATPGCIDRPRSMQLAGDRMAYTTVDYHLLPRTTLHVFDLETLRRNHYIFPLVVNSDPDEHVHECFLTPSVAGFVSRDRLYWTTGGNLHYKKLLADAAIISAHNTRIVVVHEPPVRLACGKLINIWTFDFDTRQEATVHLSLSQKVHGFEDLWPYGVFADEVINVFYLDKGSDSEDGNSCVSDDADDDYFEPSKFILFVEVFSFDGQQVSLRSIDPALGDESFWESSSRKMHISKAGYRQYSLHIYCGVDQMTLLIDANGESVDIVGSTKGKETACWKNNLYIFDEPVIRCVRWDGVMWPISKLTGMDCNILTCLGHNRDIAVNDDFMVVVQDHADLIDNGFVNHIQTITVFSFKHDRSMQCRWRKADQWRITKYFKPIS